MPTRHANSLDGTTWTRWSVSPWSDIRWRPGEKDGNHPCPFPLDLASRVIACYAGLDDSLVIMDPFVGSGTTLEAAYEQGKRSVGFDLSKRYAEIASQRMVEAGAECPYDYQVHQTDSIRVTDYLPKESTSLVFTSPPFWRVMAQPRSADKRGTKDYDETSVGLERLDSYPNYLDELTLRLGAAAHTLVPGGHLIVEISDLRIGPNYYPLHADLTHSVRQFIPVADTIIWDRRSMYNNVRPLGFPYRFIVNRCESRLLVFRKPK